MWDWNAHTHCHIIIKLACDMEVKKGKGWLRETITLPGTNEILLLYRCRVEALT